ncbi:hypothetical protein WG66_007413 [Moniliophthora roreri]|nr:hypothetical protein WG66_007413 [Moniliophthora roreri]
MRPQTIFGSRKSSTANVYREGGEGDLNDVVCQTLLDLVNVFDNKMYSNFEIFERQERELPNLLEDNQVLSAGSQIRVAHHGRARRIDSCLIYTREKEEINSMLGLHTLFTRSHQTLVAFAMSFLDPAATATWLQRVRIQQPPSVRCA